MSNNNETVQALSHKLGEPEFVFSARQKALGFSRDSVPYGIGIQAKESKDLFLSEEDSVCYEYEETPNVTVYDWRMALSVPEIRGVLKNIFSTVSFTDEKFAHSFAGFSGGLVVVLDEDSEATFSLTSIIKKNSSDVVVLIAKSRSLLHVQDAVKSFHDTHFGRNLFVVAEDFARVVFVGTTEVLAGSLFVHKISQVKKEGKIEWYDVYTGQENVRALTEDFLVEDGSETYSHDLLLCSESHFDKYHTVNHLASHTASHLIARGIAGGGGKIIYRALSDIQKGVTFSTGKQDARFLITSSGAEVDAIPSLDIASSESVSSHSVSISHLTEKDFFYPALRGVSPYRAQAMLLSGFLEKTLDKLPAEIQTTLIETVNKKLSSKVFEMGQ